MPNGANRPTAADPFSGESWITAFLAAAKRHQLLSAAALLAVPIAFVLRDALFGGGLMVPSGFLYTVLPWSTDAPANIAALNPELSDVPLQMHPWTLFARDAIRSGSLPTWNPLVLSGTPFYSNAQAALFGPFNLPVWLLPLGAGLALSAFLKLWIAGIGAYLFARQLRCSFWPGVVAGVAFSLCAFNVLWLSHGVHVAVAVLLPWALLLAERILIGGRPRAILGLALVVLAAALGGHPGTLTHLLGALALYAPIRGLLIEDLSLATRIKRIACVAGGIALGLGLGGFFLIPVGLASSGTVGALERLGGSFTLPDFSLTTIAFPDWWGRPTSVATDGLSHFPPLVKGGLFQERTLYAGSVTAVLALIALFTSGGWRRKAPLVVLACIGLAVAFGVPGIHSLVTSLPGFDRARDARMTLWFQLSLTLLAAFGLQALIDARVSARRIWAAAFVVVAVAVAGLLVIRPDGGTFADSGRHFLSGFDPQAARSVALVAIFWWLLLAGSALALGAVIRSKSRRSWIGVALVSVLLLVAVDMVRFADGYQPAPSPAIASPEATPLIQFLEPRSSSGRVVALGGGIFGEGLPADFGMKFGLRSPRGYDPPQPDQRYRQMLILLAQTINLKAEQAQRTAGLKALSALGTRWLVLPAGTQPPAAGSGLVLVHSRKDGAVYDNRNSVPRVRVASQLIAVASLREALGAIASPLYRPPATAIVETSTGSLPAGWGPRSAGVAQVVSESNDRVAISAQLAKPGLVVLDDRLAPGWSVTVDQRPANAVHADVAMRGVFVEAGSHTVVWQYSVPGLTAGLAVSGVSLVVWLAGCVLLVVSRRSQQRQREVDEVPTR